ncbi:hypothetical protein OSL60_26925, partial [Escherichia coli]|nr:hypothetical protein [Escherichia coli]
FIASPKWRGGKFKLFARGETRGYMNMQPIRFAKPARPAAARSYPIAPRREQAYAADFAARLAAPSAFSPSRIAETNPAVNASPAPT